MVHHFVEFVFESNYVYVLCICISNQVFREVDPINQREGVKFLSLSLGLVFVETCHSCPSL